MQITIDTREPLTNVLPVIQAAYQVTLTEGPAGQDMPAPASSPAPRRRPRRAGSKRQAGKTPARKPATGGTSRAARAAGNAQVRAWARDNGHQVSDTGRIPAVVLDAYRSAH